MNRQAFESPLVRFLMGLDETALPSLEEWDLLFQQARPNRLLPRVAMKARDRDLGERIPEVVQGHLDAALHLADKQRRDVIWELRKIHLALADLDCAPVLLKGAAYTAAGLRAGRGRVYADIDIMVPESHLGRTEQMLLDAHWNHTKTNAYDQMYYRTWTHQLPPMQHVFRSSVIDLHHTIVPRTARIALAPQRLFEAARPLPLSSPYRILAEEDMVLHSAVHLFNDGEFSHGLRDLFDLRDLIEDFARKDGFWDRMLARAELLDLRRPLAQALRYLDRVLGVTFPGAPTTALAEWLSGWPAQNALDSLFAEALSPDHIRNPALGAKAADWALDARGHYLRMPLHILVPHLARKAFAKEQENTDIHGLPLLKDTT
jgi:hypothetical protein